MSKKKKITIYRDILGITFKGSKESLRYTNRPTIKLDSNGILIYKIPYTKKYDYYPIFMARFSLGNLEMYLETGDEKYKEVYFNQVDWLYKNLTTKDNFAVWEHHYQLPFYEFKVPWIHGLAQGLGMTALLKAYQITNEKKYLNASEKIFNSFEVDIEEGGIRYIDEKDNIWLEEYALLPPPHVLNGYITILFGIYEFQKITKKNKAKDLWKNGLNTIKLNLDKYETGYWSYYDLSRKHPSTVNYHNLHIWQLNILYELTREQIFKDYAVRWGNYKKSYIHKKRASINRGIVLIRRNGLINSIDKYYKRKKWNKPDKL